MTDNDKASIQPPVAYLPCRLDSEGNVEEVLMARLEDGRIALMGYTALDRFMDCCGDAHPWVLYHADQLEELREQKPFDAAFLDIPMPSELRMLSTLVPGERS